jgi:ATP-binding cassette subfamily B protein
MFPATIGTTLQRNHAGHETLRARLPSMSDLRGQDRMEDLTRYADRPLAFIARYARARPVAHGVILAAVVGAVACSIGTQYGVKFLVDTLSQGTAAHAAAWGAFALLFGLIAADNLLWRVASYVASGTFVRVTGLLRHDLFRHLTGHAPGYFVERAPGTLTSRITATSNALFTFENMLVWNVIPPCVATLGAIALVATVSLTMAAVLAVLGALVMFAMYRIANGGRELHREFADKAAAVDGEMVDVIGNMSVVASFGGLRREHRRFDIAVGKEMKARRRSLYYLERLRLLHAVSTVVLTFGILAWAIKLWQGGYASTGDVILVCTLGISVLHATRDLAVALVDVTQHVARLSEALATLLVPHAMRDHPQATLLAPRGATVEFRNVVFSYPDGRQVFHGLDLGIESGQRVALIGRSGSGKSTLIALLQRFYDLKGGRILIDDQDIARVTQASLRKVIAVVPQDIAVFQRTVRENISYGCPGADDKAVWEAAVAARCEAFIRELPDGLDTLLGARGVNLSGGQRQRIAIARAFLKDAPLLVLDEATSALDVESEQEIKAALRELMRGRTVISVAHRLSTVHTFDRVVVMSNGAVVEDGVPRELMQREGIYRELIRGELGRLAPASAVAA